MRLEPLFPADLLHARILELAEEIDAAFGGEPVVMIGVLRGCVHFYSELARAMKTPTSMDFIQVMSYQGTESSGEVQLVKDLSGSIGDKNVLLVEDIYDTGRTLDYLMGNLQNRQPKRLEVAALLRKRERHIMDVPVQFVGFEIPDQFVVGYGLDYDGEFRNLPGIYILSL